MLISFDKGLRHMEAKRGLYKKIFGNLRHLKYGYGGE